MLNIITPSRLVILAVCFILLSGCASSARIRNEAITEPKPTLREQRSIDTSGQRSNDVLFMLAFSGGGTRAAALSYGVLEELHETSYVFNDREIRLLDEVDSITSVSGGSFTAAYYGLHGDRIFEDYEEAFLRQNVQRTLINGLLNPINWIKMITTGFNRTEMAIAYYDRQVFKHATFSDIEAQQGPDIVINATDLGIGQRFSFICSDLSSFSVSRAVAASSAVPVAFAPVTLENHTGCKLKKEQWPDYYAAAGTSDNPRVRVLAEGIESYFDKENRRFIYLVDGGVTDNLGIRSLYDNIEYTGGALQSVKKLEHMPRFIIIMLVNAETSIVRPMDRENKTPSATTVVEAVSGTQIKRYNLESEILLEKSLAKWTEELSSQGNPIKSYFVKIDFESIADERQRFIFNNMATSFSLPDEEVDKLIEAGHRLLQASPEYQDFLRAIQKEERKQAARTGKNPQSPNH
jgi:NTE family protein